MRIYLTFELGTSPRPEGQRAANLVTAILLWVIRHGACGLCKVISDSLFGADTEFEFSSVQVIIRIIRQIGS
jgi:hypothetical protein